MKTSAIKRIPILKCFWISQIREKRTKNPYTPQNQASFLKVETKEVKWFRKVKVQMELKRT